MGTPMALVNITSLLASALTYLSSPILYNLSHQLSHPMWVSFVFCLLALVCGVMAGAITIYGEKHGLILVL
jgi:hypothetical protein